MKGLFLIVLIQILLLGSLVSSLDATKLTIDYNKENCVNFYVIKDNFCNKDTNITINFPAVKYASSPCKDIELRLKIEENSCMPFSTFGEIFLNDTLVSCNTNLRRIFESSCKLSYASDYYARMGDGLERNWKIEVYSQQVKVGELSLFVTGEDKIKQIRGSLFLRLLGAVVFFITTLLTFIFSFKELKKNKKLALVLFILGIASFIIAIVLLQY